MQPFGIPSSTPSAGCSTPSRRRGGEELQEPAGAVARSLPGRRGTTPGHGRHSARGGASSSVSAAVAAARSASAEAAEQAKGSAAMRMACHSPCMLGLSPEFTTPGSSASETFYNRLYAFDMGFTPSPIARGDTSALRGSRDQGSCGTGASLAAGPRLAAFEDAAEAPVAPMLAGQQAMSPQLVIAPALAGPGQQQAVQRQVSASSLASHTTPAKTSRRPSRRRLSEKTSAQGLALHGSERRAISCDELARMHITPERASAERRACSSRPSKRSARARSEWPESAGAYERLDCMEAELLGPRGRGTCSAGLTLCALPDAPLPGQPLPAAVEPASSTWPETAGSIARTSQRRSQRRHRSSHSSKGSRRSLRNDVVPEVALAGHTTADLISGDIQEELQKQVALRELEIEKLRWQLAAVEGEKEREGKNLRLLRKQLELVKQPVTDDLAHAIAQRDKHAHRRKGLERELQEVRKQLTSVREEAESRARGEVEAERAKCKALGEQMAMLQRERSKALQLLRAAAGMATADASTADPPEEAGGAEAFDIAGDFQLEEQGHELIDELLKARAFQKSELERLISDHTAAAAERDRLRTDHEALNRQHANLETEWEQIQSSHESLLQTQQEKASVEANLIEKLQKEQSATAALHSELEAMTTKFDDMCKQHAALEEQMQIAQEEQSASNEKIQQLQQECDQLKASEAVTRGSLDEVSQARFALTEELEVLRTQLSTERSERSAEKQSHRQRFDEESQRWKREEEMLRSERDTATKASLDAQSKLEALQKSFTSLKADHEQALSTETHLKSKLRQQEEKEKRQSTPPRPRGVKGRLASAGFQISEESGMKEQGQSTPRADAHLAAARLAEAAFQVSETAAGSQASEEVLMQRLQDDLAKERQAKEELQAVQAELEESRDTQQQLEQEVEAIKTSLNAKEELIWQSEREWGATKAQYQQLMAELQAREQRLREDLFVETKANEEWRAEQVSCEAESKVQEMQVIQRRKARPKTMPLPSKVTFLEGSTKIEELQGELEMLRTDRNDRVLALQGALDNVKREAKVSTQLRKSNRELQHANQKLRDQLAEEHYLEQLDSDPPSPRIPRELPGLYMDLTGQVEAEGARVAPVDPSVRWIVSTPTNLESATSPWDSLPSPKSKTQVRGTRSLAVAPQSDIAEEQEPTRAPRRSTDPFLLHQAELVDQGVSIEGLLDNADMECH